jgi:copper transport protein
MTGYEAPQVALITARVLVFLSHALLFGLVPIGLFVLRPAFATATSKGVRREYVSQRAESLLVIALIMAFLGTAFGVLNQVLEDASLRGEPVGSRSFRAVLETSFGQWHALRAPLIVAVGILVVGRARKWLLPGNLGPESEAPRRWWAVWFLLSTALLATISLSGHAAGQERRALAVANDLCHLVAGSTWITGIVGLTYLLPGAWSRGDEHAQLALMAPAVDRFSRVAYWSIMIVTATGVIQSLQHLGALADLFGTSYGRALLVKLAAFVSIVALGSLNHYRMRSRLLLALEAGVPTPDQRLLRRNLTAELCLGLALIVATAFLVGFPPPSQR